HCLVGSCSLILVMFLFSLLRPPRSTLFPYTTLFRSQRLDVVDLLVVLERDAELRRARLQDPEQALAREAAEAVAAAPHPRAAVVDRKSTRLNSSHVKISYAVFCLKKKNNGDLPRRHQ